MAEVVVIILRQAACPYLNIQVEVELVEELLELIRPSKYFEKNEDEIVRLIACGAKGYKLGECAR